MRPFDSATLSLSFEAGRIVGQVVLSSNTLNLTVDLAVDPGALFEALALRQQLQLEKVDGIHTKPVQLVE